MDVDVCVCGGGGGACVYGCVNVGVCVFTGAGVGGDGGMRLGNGIRDRVLGGMGALGGEDDEDGLVFGDAYAHPLGGLYTYIYRECV